MTFGWLKSVGELGVSQFKVGSNLIAMGASTDPSEHKIPENTPISDQLNLSSCVGNASADMLEILQGLQNPNNVKQLSRLFLYWNARLASKATDKDQGCYIHLAMQSMTTLGVCEETSWPYDPKRVFAQPPILSYKQGDDNTLRDFYQITTTGQDRLNDVEAAVRANHPVIFGTLVSKDLESYGGEDKVFGPPATNVGGHAILIVGVRRNPNLEFYIRNSWGDSWGQNGHCWFSADYITWDQTSDLFVGTKMNDLLL